MNAYNANLFPSIRAAALAYNVNPQRVQRRHQGKNSLFDRFTNGRLLNEIQKQMIIKYINNFDKINMQTKSSMIIAAVNFFLWHDNQTVSFKWFKWFKIRNPQLFARKQKPLFVDRTVSQNVKILRNYFYKLQKIMKENNIQTENIWNMDETGFRIDCDKFHIVIILNFKKSLRMMNSNNRDYITSIEIVFVADGTLSSMLVFKKMNTLVKWAMKNDLNENIVFECSQSGFANDEIAVDWL